MRPIFLISIAAMENGQVYSVIKSLEEGKAQAVQAPNLKLLMTKISKSVRKRHNLLQRFPAPPASKILSPGETQVLWTPNGH